MANKSVIWIDDSPMRMENVVVPVIKPMWSYNIKSKIYILGNLESEFNNYQESECNRQIDSLNKKIKGEFFNYLYDNNITSDDDFLSKYHLINNSILPDKKPELSDIDSSIVSNIAENKNDLSTEKELDKWFKIKFEKEKDLKEDGESLKHDTRKFRERFTKEMPPIEELIEGLALDEKSVVLLDMCLVKGDLNKLYDSRKTTDNKDVTVPILSMKLFNELKKKNNNVFIYTSYDCPIDTIENWENCYKILYGDSVEKIYNRMGKSLINNNEENLIEKICKIFD